MDNKKRGKSLFFCANCGTLPGFLSHYVRTIIAVFCNFRFPLAPRKRDSKRSLFFVRASSGTLPDFLCFYATAVIRMDNLAQKWTIWHNGQPSWQHTNPQSGIFVTRHRSCTTYSEHVQQREPARQTKHLLQQVTQQREMFNLGVDTLTRLHNRNSSTP